MTDSHSSSGATGQPAGGTGAPAGPAQMEPGKVVRSKAYLSALVLAAILGIPISAVAYGFLSLVSRIQTYVFDDLPAQVIGGAAPPAWWCRGWCSAVCSPDSPSNIHRATPATRRPSGSRPAVERRAGLS